MVLRGLVQLLQQGIHLAYLIGLLFYCSPYTNDDIGEFGNLPHEGVDLLIALVGERLARTDEPHHLVGSLSTAFGKLTNLGGYHCESSPMLSCPRRLYRRIER